VSDEPERHHEPGFAPTDLTDGRRRLEWQSRYRDKGARLGIALEAAYLGILLIGLPILILLVWLGSLQDELGVSQRQYQTLATFGEAWLAGALGGATFAMKWLYHVVGHGTWHTDRRLWRFFAPVISGTLAFALIALATSGLFDLLDAEKLRTPSAVVGLSFLLGYFSDNTSAKLADVAERLLGEMRRP
jgi:hypothetical protein